MTKKQATERLVGSFHQISADWMRIVADHKNEVFFEPMWSTVFVVGNDVDQRKIEELLVEDTDEESETFGVQMVGETGIMAQTIDDELILGINGAGYDFYDSHWIPLYNALGYEWHDEKE